MRLRVVTCDYSADASRRSSGIPMRHEQPLAMLGPSGSSSTSSRTRRAGLRWDGVSCPSPPTSAIAMPVGSTRSRDSTVGRSVDSSRRWARGVSTVRRLRSCAGSIVRAYCSLQTLSPVPGAHGCRTLACPSAPECHLRRVASSPSSARGLAGFTASV